MVRRAQSTERTRAAILDAATRIFWEEPSRELTLDAIAREAGVTVQTVIRHFGGRDGVFEAAVQREMGRVKDERDPAAVSTPAEAVRQLVAHYERTGDHAIRLLAEEHRSPTVASLTAQGRAWHRSWCEQVFATTLSTIARQVAASPARPARRGLRRLHVEAPASRRRPGPEVDGARDGRAAHPTAGGFVMARVLAYTSPARGDLYPLVPILDELRGAGPRDPRQNAGGRGRATHGPRVSRGADRRADRGDPPRRLEGEGRQGVAGRRDVGLRRSRSARRSRPPVGHRRRRPGRPRPRHQSLGSDGGGGGVGPPMGRRCALSAADQLARRATVRPGLAPARGPLGRLRDALVRPLVIGAVERTILPRLNAVRAAIDPRLSPVRSADDLYSRPPLLLYLTAEPFEYHRRSWPGNVRMVGPCAWEPELGPRPGSMTINAADRPRLDVLGVPGRCDPGADGVRRPGRHGDDGHRHPPVG